MFPELPPTRKNINEMIVNRKQWLEALWYFESHINELIKAAAFSRDNAVSHRQPPFKVGCAVMSIEPGLEEGEYAIYQSYNFKPEPAPVAGIEKRCAERSGLDVARQKAKVIVGLATISKELSTGDPTRACDALHPCQECLTMLRNLLEEGFLREDSIICNANDSKAEIVIEKRTLKELLDLYK